MKSKLMLRSDQQLTSSSKNTSSNEETPLNHENLIVRLQEILESLQNEKQMIDNNWAEQRSVLETTIQRQEKIIKNLQTNSQILQNTIISLNQQMSANQQQLEYLKKAQNKWQPQKHSLENLVRYLQTKNQEINFENYALKKLLLQKEGRMAKKTKRYKEQVMLFESPKWFMSHLQEDKVFDSKKSPSKGPKSQFHKVESMPTFELDSMSPQKTRTNTIVKQSGAKKKNQMAVLNSERGSRHPTKKPIQKVEGSKLNNQAKYERKDRREKINVK